MRSVLQTLATSDSTVAAMYPCLSELCCIVSVLPISTVRDAFHVALSCHVILLSCTNDITLLLRH